MVVSFRMDDIAPNMDWIKFNRLKDLFVSYGIKPLIGIIPDNQDPKLTRFENNPEFWAEMQELASIGWSIAQHGYKHVYETKDGGILKVNDKSEFAGLTFEIQLNKVQKGKEILNRNGLHTDIWMAPSHSYDQNTLKALIESGFRYVTDGYSLYPYSYMGLDFIPCQTSKPIKFPMGVYTVCIHPNQITEEYICCLKTFIENNRKNIRDYNYLKNLVPINHMNYLTQRMFLILRSVLKGKK